MNIILTDSIMENHISLENMKSVLNETFIVNIDKASLDIQNKILSYKGISISSEVVKKVWPRVDKYTPKLKQFFIFFENAYILNKNIDIMNDKLASSILVRNHNIDIIPTYPLSILNFDMFNEFPYIVKTTDGYAGQEVEKINSREELDNFIVKFKDRDLLIQPFLPEGNIDYRVIIAGEKILRVLKRKSINGDFRANTSQGGKKELVKDYDYELAKAAINVSRAFKADIVGLDFIKHEGKYLFCEVNNSFRIGDRGIAFDIKNFISFL